MYVVKGYVVCDYVEGDSCVETHEEYIKVFGFSRTLTIYPTEADTLDEIKRDYARKSYRKVFRFPAQVLDEPNVS